MGLTPLRDTLCPLRSDCLNFFAITRQPIVRKVAISSRYLIWFAIVMDNKFRSRLRFRLRTILLSTVIAATLLSFFANRLHQARKQRHALESLKDVASVTFQWEASLGVKNQDGINQGIVEFTEAFKARESQTPRGPEFLRNILGDDFFNKPVSIRLSDPDPEDLRALGSLTSIESLGISDLASSSTIDLSNFGHLRRLIVNDAPGFTGREISQLPNPDRLQFLNLANCGLSQNGLQQIGRCTNLLELGIAMPVGGEVNDKSTQFLSSLSCLNQVVFFSVPVGRRTLNRLSQLRQLRFVRFYSTDLHSGDLNCLSKCPSLSHVKVYDCAIDDSSLSRINTFPSLRLLELGFTDITDEGVRKISESRTLRNLALLNGNTVTDRCLGYLESMLWLEELTVSQSDFSQEAIDRLKESLQGKVTVMISG